MKKKIFVILAVLSVLTTACSQKKTVIVQVSDPQFGFWNDNDISYEVGTYNRCIDELNELKPDAVVLTGDLVNHTWVGKQWEALHDITARLDDDIPVWYIPGNHDVNKKDGKLDMTDYYAHMEYARFAEKVGQTLLIGIDSNPIKECFGSEEEEEQFRWLEGVLKNNRKMIPIIFLHHPFFLEDLNEEEGYFQLSLQAREKYFALFEKYGVKGVFSGHLHQNRVASYKGSIPVVTTSAIGVQLGNDKSGYRIITVEKGNLSHEYVEVDMD